MERIQKIQTSKQKKIKYIITGLAKKNIKKTTRSKKWSIGKDNRGIDVRTVNETNNLEI